MSSQAVAPSDDAYRREVTWRGAFALFSQRMYRDVRNKKFHASLALLIFVSFLQASHSASISQWTASGTPGLDFLTNWGFMCFFLICLGGGAFFVRLISEEKDQGTLALLKLTGIGPLGILSGLIGSRLAQVLVVFVLQLPMILWSVTLGGVTLHQVFAMFLTLISTLFLIGSLALFSAVIAPGSLSATILCYFLLLVPIFAHLGMNWTSDAIEGGILVFSGSSNLNGICLQGMEFLETASPYHRLKSILITGYAERLINLQVITCISAGFTLFVVSVMVFDRFTRTIEPASMVTNDFWSFFRSTKTERKSERCWDNPYIWREFEFRKQGFRGLIVSAILAVGLNFLLLSCFPFILDRIGYSDASIQEMVVSITLTWRWIFSVGACLISPLAVATVLVGELKQQTFGTLFLVDRKPETILFGLITGRLLLLLHLLIWLIVGFIFSFVWQPEMNLVIDSISVPSDWNLQSLIPIVTTFVSTIAFFGIVGIRLSLNQTPLRKQLFWVFCSLLCCPPCIGGPIFLMLFSPIFTAKALLIQQTNYHDPLNVYALVIAYAIVALPVSLQCWDDSIRVIRDRMEDN